MRKKIFFSLILIGVIFATTVFLFLKIEKAQPKTEKPTPISTPTLTLVPTTSTPSTFKDFSSISSANNQFNLDLYKNLIQKEKSNIFFSPYSIFSALAMTYEGSAGKTADEIKTVFYFPENNILRTNFSALYHHLNQKDNEIELKTANALWLQKNYPLLFSYLEPVEKYYHGKATNLDFVNETEKSRQIINQYIEEETNKKIKDLIPKDSITTMTRLVLTNAIYFKGVWRWQFDEKRTNTQNFFIRPDHSVEVPMMNMSPEKAEFNYFEDDEVQVLELPYKGEKITMVIILPKKGLDLFESSLNFNKLKEYQAKKKLTKLDVITLPKFKLETKYFLEENLSALGMGTAFSRGADFSKITGKRDLFISSVIHQAFVEVDEKGTEAAAATAVIIIAKTAIEKPPKIFRADHPFLFYILDKESDTILFFGRVIDPRG